MSTRIEDYALIGDGKTAALVNRSGSIDWLCWPRFDSPACFAALLGEAEHGRWLIAPAADCTVKRRYHADTLILETTFDTPTGSVLLIDFMPPGESESHIVRIVRGISGCVPCRSELLVRFDYGSIIPLISQPPDVASELHAVAGPDRVTLRTSLMVRRASAGKRGG